MFLRRNFLWIFLASSGLLCSCGSPNFETIVKNASKDESISIEEWNAISNLAQKENRYCNEDGTINVAELKNYILEVAHKKLRGIENINFPKISSDNSNTSDSSSMMTKWSEEPIKMKFFLERSGSMTPYDSPRTKGDFKAGISRLLNSIPSRGGEKNILYVVNNSVNPYRHTYKEFLQSKDIFKDTRGVGDPRYTDFTCIFDSILSRTNSNELSILASDLIYSTKEMAEVNPQKIRNEAQTMTTSIFKDHTDKEVLVIKLIADYDGKYYPYNSPNAGLYYHGNRPYYLMMVGGSDVMRRIFFDEDYKEFSDIEHLKGFENYYYFSRYNARPYYSVLLSHKLNKGRFGAVKGSGTTVHEIENVTPERNGKVAITLAIDLSSIVSNELFKQDPANYEITSLADFKVEEIVKIEAEDCTPTIKRYAPSATHLIVLSTEEAIKNETLQLKLKNKLPKWIVDTNSDDDTDLNNSDFAKTTFAFSYLMQGIYDSFHSSVEDPCFFSISLKINK